MSEDKSVNRGEILALTAKIVAVNGGGKTSHGAAQ